MIKDWSWRVSRDMKRAVMAHTIGVMYHHGLAAFIGAIIRKYRTNQPLMLESHVLMTILFGFFIQNHSE